MPIIARYARARPANQSLSHFSVESTAQKYFASRLPQIKFITLAVSSLNEGRIAIVTDVGMGCGGRENVVRANMIAGRVDEIRERSGARETSGMIADGEVVWSWHPLLVSSLAEVLSARPGA